MAEEQYVDTTCNDESKDNIKDNGTEFFIKQGVDEISDSLQEVDLTTTTNLEEVLNPMNNMLCSGQSMERPLECFRPMRIMLNSLTTMAEGMKNMDPKIQSTLQGQLGLARRMLYPNEPLDDFQLPILGSKSKKTTNMVTRNRMGIKSKPIKKKRKVNFNSKQSLNHTKKYHIPCEYQQEKEIHDGQSPATGANASQIAYAKHNFYQEENNGKPWIDPLWSAVVNGYHPDHWNSNPVYN